MAAAASWCLLLLVGAVGSQRVQIDERASSSTNLPLGSVADHLVQTALGSLGAERRFANGQLVGAQKLVPIPR